MNAFGRFFNAIMNELLTLLAKALAVAEKLEREAYQAWTKRDLEEFPPYDADGRYVMHSGEPSDEHRRLNREYRRVYYCRQDIGRALHELKQT